MIRRHRIQFPRETRDLTQDEAFFYLLDGGQKRRIRFHDYADIYAIPGLYEQIFYERLKCSSHRKVCDILGSTVERSHVNLSELRVLDLGAGNGLVGEVLKGMGVSRVVGVDILPAAAAAAERDRPGVYDEYFVADLINLGEDEREEIESWALDCLTTVAALGFGDIPPMAFIQAFNLLRKEAWVTFNIKESFLDHRDGSGFSDLIRRLIFSDYFELHHLERYRHRLSISGEPLYYFAVAGKKNEAIPVEFLSEGP